MPIHIPGIPRMYRRLKKRPGGKDPVAPLSLTALVDMFSVLAVFLLQSYASTGAPIELPDNQLTLPKSHHIREANPAHVISISRRQVFIDKKAVASISEVKESSDWLIPGVFVGVRELIEQDEKLAFEKGEVPHIQGGEEESPIPYYKVYTVQADKDTDFFLIKKVLYSLTEAGVIEINFTVEFNERVRSSL